VVGKWDVLSLMLESVGKGHCGNRRNKDDCDAFPYIAADLSEEQNQHNITYQFFGTAEPFLRGRDTSKIPLTQPQWFRIGHALFDVKTQLEIVAELIGASPLASHASESLVEAAMFVFTVDGTSNDGCNDYWEWKLVDKTEAGSSVHSDFQVSNNAEMGSYSLILHHIETTTISLAPCSLL